MWPQPPLSSFWSCLAFIQCSPLEAGRQAGTLELCSVLVTVALMSPQNIMFYDMGSGSTVCTIVTYQTVKTKDAGMQPQLQIRGVG